MLSELLAEPKLFLGLIIFILGMLGIVGGLVFFLVWEWQEVRSLRRKGRK